MATVQIKFKPDYEDHLAVGKATTYNTTTIILLVLMGVFAVITLVGFLTGWIAYDPENLGLYLVPHLLYIFFLLYTPFHLRNTARQSANEGQETTWQVTQRGVTVNSGKASDRHLWKAFNLAQELPKYYILYFKTSRVKFIFVPKTAFTSSAQEANFREIVTTALGKIK
ncbi:MAG: YcxB family protein [Anaerolineaceae bacterium]|jgi:hypothetical protein|nr:YcxB family protein [Anaerolineaceae bacterium]